MIDELEISRSVLTSSPEGADYTRLNWISPECSSCRYPLRRTQRTLGSDETKSFPSNAILDKSTDNLSFGLATRRYVSNNQLHALAVR